MNTPSAKPPGDRMHSPPPSPASERATAYLHPGQLLVSAQACAVTTILGSCVAVCLWDPVAQIGGINHFLLPTFSGQGIASPRFGNIAIKELLDQLAQLGSQKHNLLAKMFGGACVLEAFRQRQHHLGTKNIEIAPRVIEIGIDPAGRSRYRWPARPQADLSYRRWRSLGQATVKLLWNSISK